MSSSEIARIDRIIDIHTIIILINCYAAIRQLARLEFELPRDPDVQKQQMLQVTEEEHYRHIDPEDLRRIQYYLTTVS